MRSRLRAVASREDEGVALILALVFVLVMAVTVTALLPYTGSGLRASTTVREVRTVQLAADGAIEQAMGSIRHSFVAGASPACDPSKAPALYTAKDYPNPAPETGVTKVRVQYCNTGATGSFTGQPPYAIQTLQSGVEIDGNAPLVVAGGILAAESVEAKGSQQSINVQGDLFATGPCTVKNRLFVSGLERCSNSATAYTAGTDPDPTVDPLNALSAPGLPSLVDPIGRCRTTGTNSAESVVVFEPGFYSENPRVNPIECSGNKHTTWWFKPGFYYFDFPDSLFASVGSYSNADAKVRAQGVTIVGGKPLNWDPLVSKSSDVAALFKADPDHTKPSCDKAADGVVFALGGPTNIDVGTGGTAPEHLELCSGPYDDQRLSIYGVRDGASRTSSASQYRSTPTKAASTTVPLFTPAAAAAAVTPDGTTSSVDGAAAAAALVGGTATTASVTVTDFKALTTSPSYASGVPDGSLIKSAKLRVNHWASSAGGASTASKVKAFVKLTSTTASSTVALSSVTAAPPVAAGTLVDVPLPASDVRWREVKAALEGLKVEFLADGSALDPLKVTGQTTRAAETATAHLDGIEVIVEFVAPRVEKTRCPNGDTGFCNVVTNKVDDALFLHGTVYTPLAQLEASVHNYSTTVFERGVVAARVWIHVNASAKQTLPPFQLPRGPNDRLVRFTAQSLEPDGSWRDRLVALVRYDDFQARPDGQSTAIPGHRMTVKRWTVVR